MEQYILLIKFKGGCMIFFKKRATGWDRSKIKPVLTSEATTAVHGPQPSLAACMACYRGSTMDVMSSVRNIKAAASGG